MTLQDNAAPVADAPIDAPAPEDAAPVIQETNVPVSMMIDNVGVEDEPAAPVVEEAPAAPVEPESPAAPVEPAAPAPVVEEPVQITDPGDFTPNDYSFEIKLADGTAIKVATPEDIELLNSDIEFASPAELIKAQANFTKMVTGIENDKAAYEADKEKFDANQTAVQQQEEFVAGIEAGMGYLETSGELPPVDPKFQNADWSDPEVAKQPGVKERVELITYMAAENAKRAQAGVPQITSVLDAYNSMQLASFKQQQVQQESREVQTRKARAAMVGGETSSSQGANIPDNMIVGTGGSIRDFGSF